MALVLLASTVSFAAADKMVCKKSAEATAQGVELTITGKTAVITNKGQKVAKLVLVSQVRTGEIVTETYSQQTINGYSAKVVSGGIVASVTATILHDGFAGPTPVAQLGDCR